MRNPKKITKQAILIQGTVVREPSAVPPIRGTFLLKKKNKKIKIETSLYVINITKFVVSLISLNDKFDAISFN